MKYLIMKHIFIQLREKSKKINVIKKMMIEPRRASLSLFEKETFRRLLNFTGAMSIKYSGYFFSAQVCSNAFFLE